MPARSEPYRAPAIVTFAKELEWRRTQAGISKRQLGEKLGFADSYVGQVELCKNLPSEEFAEALDTFFETDGIFRRLWQRIQDTRHLAVLSPGFPEYLEREAEATQIRAFGLGMFSGLLQTEQYARAVMGANQRPGIVEQLVQERLKRQEMLLRDDAPQAWFTLDEMVLRRTIGGPEIMRDQLAHILELNKQGNIWIDVVPQDTGYYPGLGGNFIMLSFPDSPDVAYIEAGGHGLLLHDAQAVAEFAVRYNMIRGDALRVQESRALITKVMEEIGS
jgi:transcriptional regulator with XRE-family HTH domain